MSLPNNDDPTIRLRFSSAASSYHANAKIQACVANELVGLLPAKRPIVRGNMPMAEHSSVTAGPRSAAGAMSERHFGATQPNVQRNILPRAQATRPTRTLAFQPKSILEVGCGTGALTQRLLDRFPSTQVTAIDVASEMIDQARQIVRPSGRVAWHVAGLADFPATSRFDMVASSSALHWITPFQRAIMAVDRLVDPGGHIVLAIMLRDTLKELHQSRLHVAPRKPPATRLPEFSEVCQLANQMRWQVQSSFVKSYVSTFDSARGLFLSLHHQGLTGGPVSRSHAPLNRTELHSLVRDYDIRHRTDEGKVAATFQVGFLRAVKTRR